jgi:hypothetical protein
MCVANERLIDTWLMGTFGAVSGPDSVHQFVDFSMSSKRHHV